MTFTVEDIEQYKEGLSDKGKKRWVKVANLTQKLCIKSGGDSEKCNDKAIKMANRFTRFTKKTGKRVKAKRTPKKTGKKVEVKNAVDS